MTFLSMGNVQQKFGKLMNTRARTLWQEKKNRTLDKKDDLIDLNQ
jgi:hypothetical protein